MKIPKYQQIKQDLLKEINSEKFVSGDKFYSEKELINKYGVSSITVIKAINELANEGFLNRIQGKGTFISRSRKRKLVEFSDIEIFPTKHDKVKVLSIEKENNLSILDKLNLTPQQFYYKITRLRFDKKNPYFVQTSYLPEKYINKDKLADLKYYESIYYRLKHDFNLNVADQDSIETDEITMAPPEFVTTLLGIDSNIPLVKQEKLTKIQETEEVIEFIQSYKKLDYFKIEFSSVHL